MEEILGPFSDNLITPFREIGRILAGSLRAIRRKLAWIQGRFTS